jgi:hypothetical protein
MDEKFAAALIGAGAALAVSAIKDVATPILSSIQQRRTAVDDALERYAVPLAESAASVFFRLHEILEGGRYQYLLSGGAPTEFHRYKYESTVYRLCILLGWIWALKKESSLLIDRGEENARSLHRSVESIEASFADGPHVERDRLERLATLWGLKISRTSPNFDKASVAVNSLFHDIRYGNNNISGHNIKNMNLLNQKIAIERVADYVTEYFGESRMERVALESTVPEAVAILSPRQAWIFRDWQAVIGCQMMKEVNRGPSARLFDAIEFDEFLILYRSENEWIKKIDAILTDLNPTTDDPNEYRVLQLR